MKYRYTVILFALAFILQPTLLSVVGLFGVTPNLTLCLVIVLTFLYDEGYQGLVLGIIFGLLYDVCFSTYIGVSAIGYFIVSLSIMLINVIMNKEAVLSIILIAVGGTVLFSIVYWGITALLGSNYGFSYMLERQPLYIVYNTVVVVLLYYAFIRRVVKYHRDKYYK